MSEPLCQCGHPQYRHAVRKLHGTDSCVMDGCNCDRFTSPPTPRVARSVDDLRVGMVVAWCDQDGYWTAARSPINNTSLGDWSQFDIERGVVILADPPAPPAADWLVPADTMEALREALERPALSATVLAARAVLDAATEVER